MKLTDYTLAQVLIPLSRHQFNQSEWSKLFTLALLHINAGKPKVEIPT